MYGLISNSTLKLSASETSSVLFMGTSRGLDDSGLRPQPRTKRLDVGVIERRVASPRNRLPTTATRSPPAPRWRAGVAPVGGLDAELPGARSETRRLLRSHQPRPTRTTPPVLRLR